MPITIHNFAKSKWLGSPSQTVNYPGIIPTAYPQLLSPSQGNTLQMHIRCTQSSKRKEQPQLIARAVNVRNNHWDESGSLKQVGKRSLFKKLNGVLKGRPWKEWFLGWFYFNAKIYSFFSLPMIILYKLHYMSPLGNTGTSFISTSYENDFQGAEL